MNHKSLPTNAIASATWPPQPLRSKWSSWVWTAAIAATFLLGYSCVSLKAALGCSAAMFVSALLHRAVGSPFILRRITIRSFWFLSYLAMVFSPAFFVYANQRDPFRGTFLFAVTSVLVTVPLGFALASWWSNFRESETEAFFQQPLGNGRSQRVPLKFVVLLGIGLVLIALYLRQVDVIPIFYLLRHPGDYWILALLREDSFKLLTSSFMYAFYMARGLLFPFVILTSFGYFITGRKKEWLLAFIIALLSGLFFASMSIAKSPVAAIFLMLALWGYYYRRGSFNFKYVSIATGVIFAFPIFVALAVGGEQVTFVNSLQGLQYRLLYAPADDLYYYFEFFPAHMGHLHGGSSHALSSLFGVNLVNTPNLVGLYTNPNNMESISLNVAFIGDLHADFGLGGVLIGGVMVGVIMQAFHIYVVRKRKTVCSLAAYSFLIYTFWFLNSTSLPVVLASDGAVAVLVLLWFFDGKPWPRWFSRDVQPALEVPR